MYDHKNHNYIFFHCNNYYLSKSIYIYLRIHTHTDTHIQTCMYNDFMASSIIFNTRKEIVGSA